MIIDKHKMRRESALKRRKDEGTTLTECYIVTFTIKGYDNYWDHRSEKYYSDKRCDHENIKKKWEKDYNNREVRLISVVQC